MGLASFRQGSKPANKIASPSVYLEPWEDPKNGSTLGLYNLCHRSIKSRIRGSSFGSSQDSGYGEEDGIRSKFLETLPKATADVITNTIPSVHVKATKNLGLPRML